MREQTRYSLSGGLSIVLHALFVLAFAWSLRVQDAPEPKAEVPDWEVEFVEFDVQDIEPDAAQGEPEPEPPEEEPPAEEESAPPPVEQPIDPESDKPAPPEPEPEPEPKPRFGAKKSKVGALVPPNATWSLVLVNSRIKKLPFRDAATELMAPLSDFQMLVDKPGFDVWEDFNYVVMGSPDARDMTQAFVAVEYTFGHAEMKAGIERGCAKSAMGVTWREDNGAQIGTPYYLDPEVETKYGDRDPREFVLLPGDKVALYLRPEFVPQVVAGPDASKGKTSGNFVANIAKIKRFVRAEPKAGVQLVVEDIRRLFRHDVLPIELPSRAELMWEAAKNPELVIKLDFLEAAHAEAAHDFWTNDLKQGLEQIDGAVMVMGIVAATKVEVDGRQLILRHEFNERAAELVLEAGADLFGKAMNWSKDKALEAKAEREKNWELREDGNKLPSEAFEPEEEEAPDATGETGEAEPGEGEGETEGAEPSEDVGDEPDEDEAAGSEPPADDEPSPSPDAPSEPATPSEDSPGEDAPPT